MRLLQSLLLGALFAFACVTGYAQTDTAIPPMQKITRDDALSAAFRNNPAYQAAIQDRQSAMYTHWSSWGGFLPTGELSWSVRNTRSSRLTTPESWVASAGINLFNGFRTFADTRKTKLNYAGMTEKEKETFLRMVMDVNLAYQAAQRADYLRRSSRTLFESAEILLNEAAVRQALDVITRADLYQARADREKAYSSLIDAEVNYDAAVLEIARLTGLAIDNSTILLPDDRTYILHDLNAYKSAALNYSTTLQQSTISMEMAAQDYYSSWGFFMPSVDATAGTGWYSDELGEYNSNYIGLTARWNVFSGLSDVNSMLAAAKALNSARLTIVDARDALMKNVEVAWLRARASHEKVNSAEIYVSAANENYIAMQEMFRLGRASLKDTVDARGTLEDAQATLADAKYVMAQAFEELMFLSGGSFSQ